MTEQGLKTAEGRMGRIDTGTRMFVFRPDKDFAVDVYWSVGQDEKLSKFKEGYKAKATYETDKQGKHWLTEIISTYKKDGGNKQFVQRNECLILGESLMKSYVELYIETTNLSETDFEKARQCIVNAVEQDMVRLMQLCRGG